MNDFLAVGESAAMCGNFGFRLNVTRNIKESSYNFSHHLATLISEVQVENLFFQYEFIFTREYKNQSEVLGAS